MTGLSDADVGLAPTQTASAAPSGGLSDADVGLGSASAPQAGGWQGAWQEVKNRFNNPQDLSLIGMAGQAWHGVQQASKLGSGEIDPSTPEGSLAGAEVAAQFQPMSPAMGTGKAIARAATAPRATGADIASRAGQGAVAAALDVGPPVATPRENLGISLLPHDVPHLRDMRVSDGPTTNLELIQQSEALRDEHARLGHAANEALDRGDKEGANAIFDQQDQVREQWRDADRRASAPPDAAVADRRSVGAAGTEGAGPLAEASPDTIAKMRSLLEQEGFTPYTLEQRLEEMSQHDFLGELSPNTSLLMSALASKGPARNEIFNSVKQRALEAKDRMSSAFDDAFGEGENMAQLAQITKIDRDKQSAPFYRQFRNTEIPPTQELSALLPRLEAAGALRAANKSLAVEGLPSSIGFGETDLAGNLANEQRIPTASAFQYAKEHLDKLIEQSLASHGGANDARRYTTLKNALVDAIDNHPDPNVAGIWRQARDTYAGPTQTLKAASFGKQLLTGNVNAEELPFMTSSYSPSEMRALNIGVRSYLEDIAGRPGKTDLKVINQILAPNNQSKIRWVAGDAAADRLIGAIEHEQRMHAAPNSLIYNSMTQPRQEAAKFWEAQPGWFGPAAGGLKLTDLAHGANAIPGKLAQGAVNVGLARRAAAQAAKDAKVQEEAARLFTLQGPERDAVVRALVNPQSQQNVYSMGRGFAHGGVVNPQNINHAPTEAQKKSGNYAKDHIRIHGLDIAIENARGSIRSGVDSDGKPWQVRMPCAYGYIRSMRKGG